MTVHEPSGQPTGGQFAVGQRAEPVGVDLDDGGGMTARETSRFHEMKLASAAKMLRRGEEDGWGGMGPGFSAGWRDADADIALRVAMSDLPADDNASAAGAARELLTFYAADPTQLLGCRQVRSDTLDALAQYAFDRTLAETVKLTAAREADTKSRAGDTACGARNAYALSYAQLKLRSVDDSYAHTVADRLTAALYDGETDPGELHDIAWDVKYPIDDFDDEAD